MMMMWQKQACGFCPEGGAGDACAACGAGLCFERLGCRCRNRVVQEEEVPMSTNRFQRACQGEQRAGETPRVVEPSSPVQRQCSTLIREGPPKKWFNLGFCEIWEHKSRNSDQKRRFVFFGSVWESATPPAHPYLGKFSQIKPVFLGPSLNECHN